MIALLRSFRCWLGVSLASGAFVIVGATIVPTTARAGAFHVYSCTDPQTGAILPTAGWTASGSGPTFDTCASQPVSGGLGGETIAAFGGTIATWTFTASPQTEISSAVVYRSAVAGYRTRAYWAAPENVPTAADSFDACEGTDAMHACVLGEQNSSASCVSPAACYSPLDTLQVPAGNLPGSSLSLDVRCMAQGCGGSETMHSADITLAQEQGPTADAVAGSLMSEPILEGEPSIVVNASDPGAGVYQLRFTVDGTIIARHALVPSDPRCSAYGRGADGSAAFLSPQPCPTSISNVSVPFDTSRVSDGTHQLTVAVEDAAGNTVPILTRTVPFNNRGEYVIALRHREQAELEARELATRGPCNATCDSRAVLRANRPLPRRGVVRRPYVRSELTLEGLLVGHDGAPIPGAVLEVTETPSYRGASARILGDARTNGAGVWRFALPRGPSRKIVVAYRARTKDNSATAELEWSELVPAAVTLHAPRDVSPNQAFTFRGATAGGFVPPGGLLVSLEIRYAGRWREIALLHSGPRGRFHYTYTFATVPPVKYLFRALVPRSPVYPFTPGASAAAAIRLR
jgi:hypothetical protein